MQHHFFLVLMTSNEVIVATIITTVATAVLSWLFYPAWLSTTAPTLEWEEKINLKRQAQQTPILLSIVIPAYNEEHRIPEMINTAHQYLKSTNGRAVLSKLCEYSRKLGNINDGKNYAIEWVIVDDGSTDGTCGIVKSVIDSLNSKDNWILVSLTKNSGKG